MLHVLPAVGKELCLCEVCIAGLCCALPPACKRPCSTDRNLDKQLCVCTCVGSVAYCMLHISDILIDMGILQISVIWVCFWVCVCVDMGFVVLVKLNIIPV